MHGNSQYLTANALLAGINSQVLVSSFSFGQANPRQWYFHIPASSNARTVKYIGVDASLNEVSGSVVVAANSYVATTQSNLISVNQFTISGTSVQWTTANDNIYLTSQNTASSNYFGYKGNTLYDGVGIYTCPANAVAYVSSIDAAISTANEYTFANIWDVSGIRSVAGTF